jgi:metallophosphoesterase (TIGR00282 family)
MSEIAIAFLGDVVGAVGRRAVAHASKVLRETRGVGLVIVNGENARNGSGLTPDNYRELRKAGADAVTLGDHCYKDRGIVPVLEDANQPIARPANLAPTAPGKRVTRLVAPGAEGPPIYALTVLGRLFMPLMSDNPFGAIDRELAALPEQNALVIVEIHAEATSEKQAMAWHCLDKWTGLDRPRVVAVVGTHTHVQTADARILDHSLAAMTDLGMCGPHRSVIGRDISATLAAMASQMPSALDVASGENRACGAVIRVDPVNRRAVSIEAVNLAVPE